jgi:CheY-like chemotaxis protein
MEEDHSGAANGDPRNPVSGGRDKARHLVVYIEDNLANIALMQDLLGDLERVDLIVAPTAEIGLEVVAKRRPDVVIMDIHLPGMNGFEAMKRLRESPETCAIPVIALSAAARMKDAYQAVGAGFHRYLEKPIKVDQLIAELEHLLHTRPLAPA